MAYDIRTFGDPVLKTQAVPVTDVDGKTTRLVNDMFDTLYTSDNGVALAAPQIGVQRQIVVWDLGEDGRDVIYNPVIVESDGEWTYDEGCLSIPGLYVEIVRPKTILIRGINADGEEIEREADEFEARMFQHEIDHLNGVLMFDRMDDDQRKSALSEYRKLQRQADAAASATRPGPLRRLRAN